MKKRFLSLFLAVLSTVSIGFSGCDAFIKKEDPAKYDNAPDYSASTLQYDFYGYSSLIDGWNIDGMSFDVEEDYLSVERIKEYKDAGMTIYFPQSAAAYTGNVSFEQSEAKRAMDTALEAGIDKVILMDPRIQGLSKPAKEKAVGLIGEGKQFATEEELDATIASYLAPYKDHEAFYGVMLGDEPFHYHTTNYGEVYRSIKRVMPECYIQYNLNPITAGKGNTERFLPLEEGDEGYGSPEGSVEDLIGRYKKYLRGFMDATGATYIQYDQYPFRSAEKTDEYYLVGLQVVAEIAKEYDAEFYFVTQTYGQTDNQPNPRMLSEADLYWLNNMLVGFGIKQISYFTYFTKADNNAEHFIDGNSFITWRGEKTNIYHWMKQIMAEEQKLAPVILNFDYTTSKIFTKMPTVFNPAHAMNTIETADLTAIKDVKIDKEISLVTELYDEAKGYYMYMIQNIIDPIHRGSKTYQTITVTFGEEYKYLAVYTKGERELITLSEEGTATFEQTPGQAVYVIPYA